MDDNRKLAEEILNDVFKLFDDVGRLDRQEAIAILAAYGEARYKAGVEAMRDAAHPLMRWPEDHEGLDAVFARLLEAK